MLLYAFGAWTLFVWGTRIDNILAEDPWSGLDLAVAVGLLVLGVAVVVVAERRRRAAGRARPEVVPVVGVAAVATTLTWAVRTPLMFGNDHEAAFLAVHTALAVVSIALAVLAWRSVRPAADGAAATGGPGRRPLGATRG